MTRRPAAAPAAMVLVAAIAFVAAVAGIGVRATHGGHAAVDEPEYLLTALSLYEDHDLDIADELADRRWRDYFDEALPVQTAVLPGGRQISPHDPLLPALLALPVGLGGRAGWLAAKVLLAALAGAAAALTLWVALRRFAVPLGLATLGTALAFASPPLAVYGQQVYPELPAALAVLAAVAALTAPLRRGGLAVLAAAVVALPWLSVKYAAVAAGLAGLGLWRLWRGGRIRPAALLAAGWVVAAAAYAGVHRLVWGGWTVYASGDHFERSGELGVVGFAPDYAGRTLRLVGLLVDRDFGLASWQPAYLLAVPALTLLVRGLLRRRVPGHGALVLPLLVGWAVATWVALTMHGWWWPGRQVVVVLPLAVIAVLVFLARSRGGARLVALGAGAAGLVAYAALLRDGWAGRITWVVGFSGVDDPLHRAWRLLLPDYRAPGPAMWLRHVAWVAAVLALAGWGWHAGRARRAPSYDVPARRPEPAATP